MEEPIIYECTTDVSLLEDQLAKLILLSEQNQIFVGELNYLMIWFLGGLTGVFILSIIYHLVSKFVK